MLYNNYSDRWIIQLAMGKSDSCSVQLCNDGALSTGDVVSECG